MRNALEIKNKWCIVNGSIAEPDADDAQFPAWRRSHLMVCSWIFRSVHSSIAQSIMHLDRAEDVWSDLKRRFAQCDAQRISILQNEIYNLKQGNLSVSDYYTKCRTMWEDMNNLRPLPMCKCNPRHSCNSIIDEIRSERDTDQVIRFLQGLNDDYSSLKSNVLVLEPLPEVYKVYVMAEKVERQNIAENLNIHSIEINHANAVQNSPVITEESVAAVQNNRRYTNIPGGNKPKCIFCGMTGHTIDKCYKKHGYPPGWVPGYKTKGRQQNGGTVSAMNGMNDMGISTDQFQKIMLAVQNQIGQSSNSNTTAAVSLIPNFEEDHNEVFDQGFTWDDGWFS